jgi:hypothetical protein
MKKDEQPSDDDARRGQPNYTMQDADYFANIVTPLPDPILSSESSVVRCKRTHCPG